jgi:hypothetical protein
VHRARSHDFGSSCEDSASVCRAVRDRAVQKERDDREREECEASFWCSLGDQAKDFLKSDFLGIASLAVGIVCPVCGLVIGVASAVATCADGLSAGCAMSVLGAVTGGAGMAARAVGQTMYRSGVAAKAAATKPIERVKPWMDRTAGRVLDQGLAPALGGQSMVFGVVGATHDGLQPINERSPLF